MTASFFTIAHGSRMPQARVLAERLAKHHDGARLVVLSLGRESAGEPDEHFDVLSPPQLNADGWQELAKDHQWANLTEFFKPHVLRHLVGQGADVAVYLDACVDLHAPLDPVIGDLERNAAVVSTRRLGSMPIDGLRPAAADLRAAGRLGASMIVLSRHETSLQIVDRNGQRARDVSSEVLACRPCVEYNDVL